MKPLILGSLLIGSILSTHALVISEVMSNPVGDDGGREWIEVYNNSEGEINLTTLMVSMKGGAFIPVTPVSGGVLIAPRGYAIVGSTVSGNTKFTQDYSTYTKSLFKSALSLVNTGVTSIELKLEGSTVDSLPSYTAAKEGNTLSLIDGSFRTAPPTPGEENKAGSVQEEATTTPTTGSQATLPQMSPPSADIILYLPFEKIVVAGAPALFSVYSLTHAGKAIDAMSYVWSFGDGGERVGSTTTYRYFYPGRYLAHVEGTNGLVAGTARMVVRVMPPDIQISTIKNGKYGTYIDITNPNTYDLDISGWKLSVDGALFSFPKNTLLSEGVTHFPGVTMGFASTTVSSSTLIKLLFPNMDEVLRIVQSDEGQNGVHTLDTRTESESVLLKNTPALQKFPVRHVNQSIPAVQLQKKSSTSSSLTVKASTTKATTTKIALSATKKDTRIASFLKTFFR